MRYSIPDSLSTLRRWLHTHQAPSDFATERQAAFMAQQLAGTRFKFPTKGESCFPLLQKIEETLGRSDVTTPKVRGGKRPRTNSCSTITNSETCLDVSLVIFCDGACEPNPGVGGWGFVAYQDGAEIHTECGGSDVTTNNIMEMTGALMALRWFAARGVIEPVRLLCDSQYVVKGCNEWRIGWMARGWRRKGKNPEIANLELWKALDAALSAVPIKLEWVRGHAGEQGNERADALAAIGRGEVQRRDEAVMPSALKEQLTYQVA